MNEAFFELPEEKQRRIINGGFEVFSQNEYKKASTDEIAARGGISKGLLFYYFHNKRTFYMFLYERAINIVKSSVIDTDYQRITDFFELCEYAAKCKQEMMESTPYVMDFMVRTFFSQKEDVSDELNQSMAAMMSTLYADYFRHIDLSKFKEGAEPKQILQMLTWMADGYLHENQRSCRKVNLSEFMRLYRQWSAMLRQISYKEEYLK